MTAGADLSTALGMTTAVIPRHADSQQAITDIRQQSHKDITKTST